MPSQTYKKWSLKNKYGSNFWIGATYNGGWQWSRSGKKLDSNVWSNGYPIWTHRISNDCSECYCATSSNKDLGLINKKCSESWYVLCQKDNDFNGKPPFIDSN